MMAAAAEEAVTARGCTGGGPAATTSRFAAACGALSQYVRVAGEERARAGARPAVPVAVPLRPLPLMPGADVEGPEAGPAPAAQMTIVYGGRALVLDDVPADRAADLLRLAAAAAAVPGRLSSAADLLPPVARKASLQRFMEKRKGRAAARAEQPYRRPGERRDDLTLAL